MLQLYTLGTTQDSRQEPRGAQDLGEACVLVWSFFDRLAVGYTQKNCEKQFKNSSKPVKKLRMGVTRHATKLNKLVQRGEMAAAFHRQRERLAAMLQMATNKQSRVRCT